MERRFKHIILISYSCSLFFLSCSIGENRNQNSDISNQAVDNSQKFVITKELQDSSKVLLERAINLQKENGFFLITKKDTMVYLESAKLISAAISIDQSNPNFYVNLSKIQFKLDQVETAIETLEKLIKIKPNYVEAITAQGFMLEKIGQQKEAEEHYRVALEAYTNKKEKEYGDLINRVFLILLLEGKDDALKEFEEIERTIPDEEVSFFKMRIQNFNRESFIDNGLN